MNYLQVGEISCQSSFTLVGGSLRRSAAFITICVGLLIRSLLDDNGGAIVDLNKAIELNPKASEGYYSRGMAKLNIPQDSRHGVKLQKVVNCHDDTRETKV